MKIAVIIASLGRKDLLSRTIALFEQQTRHPDILVVSAPDETHVPDYRPDHFKLSSVYGTKGLCAQRNRALETVIDDYDILVFFDDDFLPGNDYLQHLEALFTAHPDWAAVTGHVAHDGIHGPGFDFDEGQALLAKAVDANPVSSLEEAQIKEHIGIYGCNMSIRSSMIEEQRFDERLPLYGWQEDIDFTNRMTRKGRVVEVSALIGVHLGMKSGRVSGLRFGYSQIANPVYLVKKGSMPVRFALRMMSRNLLANMAKSLWEEPHIDRRGRLKGNGLALFHVLTGRIEPEHILKL